MARRIHTVAEEEKTHVGRTVRAFISYSTVDKDVASAIKAGLEEYGIETFLAHEDIDPAFEWEQVILENLESTDVFIPIVTENFSTSHWTDQECGIALAKGKLIVPIAVDGNNPYGFLGKFQAHKVRSGGTVKCGDVVQAIMKRKPTVEPQILDSVIKSFATSGSWATAADRAELLLGFKAITRKQATEIFQAVLQNAQISKSFAADATIQTLYRRHMDLLPYSVVSSLASRGLAGATQADVKKALDAIPF